MTALSIGEVARRTGLRASALRFYEDAGLLPSPARVKGRRVYDADIVRCVDGLRFAQQAGCGCVRIEDCTLSVADIPDLKAQAKIKIGAQGC